MNAQYEETKPLSDDELEVASGGMSVSVFFGDRVLTINSTPNAAGQYTQWGTNSGNGPHMGPAL